MIKITQFTATFNKSWRSALLLLFFFFLVFFSETVEFTWLKLPPNRKDENIFSVFCFDVAALFQLFVITRTF